MEILSFIWKSTCRRRELRPVLAGLLFLIAGCGGAAKYIEPNTGGDIGVLVVGDKPGFLGSLDPLGTKVTVGFLSLDGVPLAQEASELVIRAGERRLGVVAHLNHENVGSDDVPGEVVETFLEGRRYKVIYDFKIGWTVVATPND